MIRSGFTEHTLGMLIFHLLLLNNKSIRSVSIKRDNRWSANKHLCFCEKKVLMLNEQYGAANWVSLFLKGTWTFKFSFSRLSSKFLSLLHTFNWNLDILWNYMLNKHICMKGIRTNTAHVDFLSEIETLFCWLIYWIFFFESFYFDFHVTCKIFIAWNFLR